MRKIVTCLLAGCSLFLWAQTDVAIDYFAEVGECEIDYDKNGVVDGIFYFFDNGLSADAILLSIDTNVRFSGVASQRVRLQKDATSPGGRFVLFRDIAWGAALTPEVGEPLRIQFAIRAEAFTNARYSVYITTGSRRVEVVPETNQSTQGWQTYSAVVPVELNDQQQKFFRLSLQIMADAGAASGTIWIDSLRALSNRRVSRMERFPIGLKQALTFLYPNRDGYAYLDNLPIGSVVGLAGSASVLGRHYRESILWIPYTFFPAALISAHSRHNADLYNYDDIQQNHPDWFLLDRNGNRIFFDDSYYVDIGLPAVRERAWQNLRDFLYRAGKPKLVYLDNLDMLVGPNRFAPSNYPTNQQWIEAVNGWFQYVGSRVQQEFGQDFGFVPNVAWAPGFWLKQNPDLPSSVDAPGVATLPYIRGFLLEHFGMRATSTPGDTRVPIYGTASGSLGPQSWDRRLLRDSIRLVTENPDKVAILIPTFWVQQYEGRPNSRERIRFAIGTCLIVQHENTYVQLDPRREQSDYPTGFYPPELYIPLGKPKGSYTILNGGVQGYGNLAAGGLFVREYDNGIVLVNPVHPDSSGQNPTFTYTVPRDLYDWDRNLIPAGTQVRLRPQTALVLWSAPEITLSITQDKTQVLPGELVQFTVTYRNTGTAPGTNVRISVPLPDGMTLVGSTPLARLENGQVIWVVPNIPVNGTGTLRFTVRVE